MGNWGWEAPAADAAEVQARHEANRVAWNQGADAYAARLDEQVEFLRAGRSNLHPIEKENLGELGTWCRVAIHLQCASGRDTLSLLNEGVERVVGIDISDAHIENARRVTAALAAPASWHRCDVLETPSALDGTADLVYTGRGALCWLHDLPAWGAVVARLLRPGGVVHVLDDHPASWLFDMNADALTPSGYDYFATAEWSRGWPAEYIGDLGKAADEHAAKHARLWPLAAVFAAVRGAGLVVEHLGEHAERYWDNFARLPDDLRRRLPLTFSILARRPA